MPLLGGFRRWRSTDDDDLTLVSWKKVFIACCGRFGLLIESEANGLLRCWQLHIARGLSDALCKTITTEIDTLNFHGDCHA
jgi:hypothetical protein